MWFALARLALAQAPTLDPGAALAPITVNGVAMALPGVPPGRYWYDAHSGLWGRVGGPAEGVVAAGLPWGPLAPDASAGATGVFVNGRQLPHAELATLAAWVGPVGPGRYALDTFGNLGPEGAPAAVNLYAASQASQAAQAGSRASSGGGAAGTFYSEGSTSTVSGGTWEGGGIVTVRNADGTSTSVGW